MKTDKFSDKEKSILRIKSVEKLIAEKYIIIDSARFHASMLFELWNIYPDDQKTNFCQNILNYCHVKNAFEKIESKENPVLLISIKDVLNDVAPYAYFKNGKIELIQKTESIRRSKFNYFRIILRLLLLISIILAVVFLIMLF